MDIDELKKKMLEDDAFVEREIDFILTYYKLKHTLRYDHSRVGSEQTESVAEHIYGMHILADYFLPLNAENTPDVTLIRNLITWHDMAEAVVGDMMSHTKTEAHRKAEADAETKLAQDAPKHMQPRIQELFEIYDAQAKWEPRFVKAIDRIEPLFHLLFLSRKSDFKVFNLGWPSNEYKTYRRKHVAPFCLLQRFDDVISKTLDTLQYFPENLSKKD